jgi:hypothetical protein
VGIKKSDLNITEKEGFKVIIIPTDILDAVKAKLGDEFIWDYDSETQELFLMKKPESYTDFLAGLGAEMWKDAGGTEYIRQERDTWDR